MEEMNIGIVIVPTNENRQEKNELGKSNYSTILLEILPVIWIDSVLFVTINLNEARYLIPLSCQTLIRNQCFSIIDEWP